MPTDARDRFPSGQLSREKALHASTDEEGFFVLLVQTSQYGEIAPGSVTQVSMVRIPAALSIRICERTSGIRDRDKPGWGERRCVVKTVAQRLSQKQPFAVVLAGL